MIERFKALTVDYYGKQTKVCQLSNISQENNVLVVRLFDPTTLSLFLELAEGLDWEYQHIPQTHTIIFTDIKHPILRFTEAILHGDEEHQAWLLEAAQCFIEGKPIPDRRG